MRNDEKTRRWVAGILAALFVPTIFIFGIYGFFSDVEGAFKSVLYSHAYPYLETREEGAEFFPMLKARISSLEAHLGETLPLRRELGELNASFQYALGKRMVLQGDHQLLTLPDGQIYDMTNRDTLAPQIREATDFYRALDGRAPFLFAYVNPRFYRGSLTLPEGYAPLDTGDRLADEAMDIVRKAGIPALDSREFLADTGYTDDELFLRTDMHWTTLAGLLAAQAYAREINRLTGANLDVSRLDVENMDSQTYPDLFLGEYGQEVGVRNSGLDDITLYWPKADTAMRRRTVTSNGVESVHEGSFRDAVIHWDAFEDELDGISVNAYAAYGLTERLEELTNLGDCEDMTILMFRDSYSASVGSFLSLLAKRVVMVDMRPSTVGAMDYVEQYDPDVVVFSHSRQMYEHHAYTLGLN